VAFKMTEVSIKKCGDGWRVVVYYGPHSYVGADTRTLDAALDLVARWHHEDQENTRNSL
jgi:hypothetical protein